MTSRRHSRCGFSLVHEGPTSRLAARQWENHCVLPRGNAEGFPGYQNQTESVARVPPEMSIAHATPHASARSTLCTPFGLRSFRLTSRRHSSCGFSHGLVHEGPTSRLAALQWENHCVLSRGIAEGFPGYQNQTESVARVPPEMSIAHATSHASARSTHVGRLMDEMHTQTLSFIGTDS